MLRMQQTAIMFEDVTGNGSLKKPFLTVDRILFCGMVHKLNLTVCQLCMSNFTRQSRVELDSCSIECTMVLRLAFPFSIEQTCFR
jgi:hypothetical protein